MRIFNVNVQPELAERIASALERIALAVEQIAGPVPQIEMPVQRGADAVSEVMEEDLWEAEQER